LTLSLAAVVWGYRGQNQLEDNWPRLKGKPCGLTPMFLQYDSRVVGLVLLLSLVLRLLTLLEWTVRKKLQESEQMLTGLYAGQPGRQASRPSAELLLRAFKGIELTIAAAAGQRLAHITPLTPLQQTLLALWCLPADPYQCLTVRVPEPRPENHDRLTLHFAKPPPTQAERQVAMLWNIKAYMMSSVVLHCVEVAPTLPMLFQIWYISLKDRSRQVEWMPRF
jgi:hypothetical protein